MESRGRTDAAVLLPLFGWPDEPGLIFTERRADLRSHAGEISFPGGRQDEGDADFAATALREAEEEIGLDPAAVELSGALPPTTTFATGYRIYPFVGLVARPGRARARAQPGRGRDRARLLARRPARELRDAPPGPPRRPDPHADLRGRRPDDLGSDRADPRRAVAPTPPEGRPASASLSPPDRGSRRASTRSIRRRRRDRPRRRRPGSARSPPPWRRLPRRSPAAAPAPSPPPRRRSP